MPVRHLDYFLTEKKLVQEAPLSLLAETRLGIDATHYIRRILNDPETKEPLVSALGGCPLALPARIESDLKALEKLSIKPVFVFGGVPLAKKERPLSVEDTRPLRRQQAWEFYEKSKVDQATSAFGQGTTTDINDVLRIVHRAFKHRRVEFLTSPYLAASQVCHSPDPRCHVLMIQLPQLVYLERHPKAYIHSIYGPNELFLFDGVDKIILSIDFKRLTFTYVSKRSLLNELGLNSEQLLDLGLLAGSEFSQTFPVLGPEFTFKAVQDLVRQYRSGLSAVMALADYPAVKNSGYVEQFCRARALVKYSLVLVAEEGRVLPLPLAAPPSPPAPTITAADVPHDLHDVFSHRFPDEVYFHVCRGLVSPMSLGALASGHWVDPTPLCGGETDDYKRFLKETLSEHPQGPRCVALALTSAALNPFWGKRPVVSHGAYPRFSR
jgi:hypothetical protein